MRKPGVVPVFLGLLLAAVARLIWFWLLGKPLIDPLGVISISLALVVLIYHYLFRR